MYGSRYRAWWLCEKGHEWSVMVSSRTGYLTGCPACNGHIVVTGFNDLALARPDLIKEWDYELNGDLLPTQVGEFSTKKVWWKHWHHESQTWHNW
jgi:hypothetical protein